MKHRYGYTNGTAELNNREYIKHPAKQAALCARSYCGGAYIEFSWYCVFA
jgi:predicted butyrate kinase (DUF1464 family)